MILFVCIWEYNYLIYSLIIIILWNPMDIISWNIIARILKVVFILIFIFLIILNPILEIIDLLPDDPNFRSIDILISASLSLRQNSWSKYLRDALGMAGINPFRSNWNIVDRIPICTALARAYGCRFEIYGD